MVPGVGFGGVDVQTKYVEIYKRLLSHPADEQYVIRLKVYCSQAQAEKVREAIFNLEKEGSK